MSLRSSFLEQRDLKVGFSKRFIFAAVVVFSMVLILLAQLVQLQVIEHENYITRADNNRLDAEPAVPARGRIFSRNGEVMADNQVTYQLSIVPTEIKNVAYTTWQLIKLANLSSDDTQRFRKNLRRSSRYEPVTLKTRLSDVELARVMTRLHHLPGVEVEKSLSRTYPHKELAGHAIGYVALIDKKDIDRVDAKQYSGTQYIGKTGVERRFETELHGSVGSELIELNALRRKLGTVEYDPPVAGTDLYMTVDLSLQQVGKQAFLDLEDPLNGAAVAIEPATGDILALVNHPNFDPSLFATGISDENNRRLKNDPNKPLFNRSVQGQYPPGSTLKPFVALAGLHYGEISSKPEYCRGFYQLPNVSHRFHDWNRGGHGAVNLNLGLAQSCDIYFYELARKLGMDRMYDMLIQFNFNRKTGVDLIGERRGLIPNTEWKRRRFQTPWYQGETLIAGIGQGYVKTTPLQLAHATATLANRGKVIAPRLVRAMQPHKKYEDYSQLNNIINTETTNEGSADTQLSPPSLIRLEPRVTHRIEIADEHWQPVVDGMISVVHGRQGTARRLGIDLPFIMAGKSGTAQVKSLGQQGERYDHENTPLKFRDHALFVAFAPIENPQIAVAVVVEHGGSGGKIAGPIAQKMIKHWLLNRPKDILHPPTRPDIQDLATAEQTMQAAQTTAITSNDISHSDHHTTHTGHTAHAGHPNH